MGRSGIKFADGGSLAVTGDYNKSDATDRSVGIKSKIGQPNLESYYLTYDLNLPLYDSFNLYSFGSYGHTSGWNQFSYRNAATGAAVFVRSFYQNGPNAVYPTYSLTSIYPNGFIPRVWSGHQGWRSHSGPEGRGRQKVDLRCQW